MQNSTNLSEMVRSYTPIGGLQAVQGEPGLIYSSEQEKILFPWSNYLRPQLKPDSCSENYQSIKRTPKPAREKLPNTD